ncbi:caspase family protein [Streptomyces sp. NPDC056486]|uniref:HD domain-containing protein n=1 Tax=Streptomyces sp. NPDC056486 TaxID=3345835 RepID=UPI00368DDC6B
MPQHKALLIGASDYDETRIDSLPFIQDDLLRLRDILTDRGFQSAEIVENKRGIIPSVVHAQVRGFLRDARPDDTLWILLSGHGHHFEGQDYLIPEDATFDVEPFSDTCIEIGWRKELEESRAAHVVFLVDACREGIQRDTKAGPPGVQSWSRRKIAASLRRKVAYVYGCSATQQSLFVRESETADPGADTGIPPGESFSLFTRAVGDVITENPHAMRLQEFFQEAQTRVTALHGAYKQYKQRDRAPQQIRVVCELAPGEQDFPLLPGPDRHTEAHPWIRSVTQHSVWQRTRPGPARDALHELCGTLASGLAAGYETAAAALRDDPWHDSELALRAHARLGFLTRRLADDVDLSPSEAALAVLLPLVEQTFWAQEADRRRGVLADDGKGPAPDRDRFGKFAQGFPRIKRRLRALEQAKVTDGSVERIRWWLYHRWLIQQPEVYAAESLKLLVGGPANASDHPHWVTESLSEKRLMRFLQEHRAAPFATARGDGLHDHDTVAASAPDEHEVREPLVAALTKAAYAMAVDPVDLPEIVVEHLGISDSVKLDELLTTVRGSDWRTSGTGRSLNAVCGHPAVQIALREHASRVDGLFRDINRANNPTLAPLAALPPYADGSRVRLGGNTPEQLSDGIRFQLAEDRVQELLMGEELYGERDLAVREVYQNALDAVRYADRRREFLRRTGRPVGAPWEGRIDFIQGVGDDGRPYLECRDNGIGMSVRELRDVFSQGGARFVDLPEYIEEQAAWAELPDPKIELHPNSRFGIGVLSYFMLADEIVVRTCRMGKDGHPGRLLKVSIAGPGNLFRVEDLGPGDECGTTVRLLLTQYRRPTSCVDVLQKVLWVAPYRTTAEHGARRQEWMPGEASLTGVELIQTSHLHGVSVSKRSNTIHPSSDPDLWWVDGRGWLLADGLWASTRNLGDLHGFVLNLYGERQPELSVNRSSIQDYDWEHAKERVSAAVPSLFTGRRSLATVTWLARLCDMSVDLADCVGVHAREADVPWELSAGTVLPYSKVGFFLPDQALLPLVTGDFPEEAGGQTASYLCNTPSLVLRWRLLTLYRAGLGEPLAVGAPDAPDPCARPSDLALLSTHGGFTRWDADLAVWRQGNSRMGTQPSPALARTGAPSLKLLYPWCDPDRTLTVTDIFNRVMFTDLSAAEVADRLTALGYRVEPLHAWSMVEQEDLPLLFAGHFGTWLEPGTTLTAAQVCVSAARAECPTPEAAQRLRELGFGVPVDVPVRETWTEEDQTVIHNLWQVNPDPAPSGLATDVLSGELASVAHESGCSLHHAAELLRGLGFTVETPDTELSDDDRAIMEYEGARPWPYRPVPWAYVMAAARRFGSPESTAERLRGLGFEVRPPRAVDEQLSKKDIEFLGPLVGHDPERALPLIDLAEVAQEADVSLSEAADRLTSLGYACAPAPALLSALRQQDAQVVRFGFLVPDPESHGSISPSQHYAAALHTGQYGPEIGDMTEAMHHLGYEVDPRPEAWGKERNAEWDLTNALRSPKTSNFRLRETNDTLLSLTTLVTVAARLSLPFHEVARKATALGLRHEAEGWFAP